MNSNKNGKGSIHRKKTFHLKTVLLHALFLCYMLKMKHDKDWFYSHIGDSSVHVLLSVGGNFGVVEGVRAAAHVVVPEAIETRLLWSCLIDFFTSEHAELHILQNTSEILGEKNI